MQKRLVNFDIEFANFLILYKIIENFLEQHLRRLLLTRETFLINIYVAYKGYLEHVYKQRANFSYKNTCMMKFIYCTFMHERNIKSDYR